MTPLRDGLKHLQIKKGKVFIGDKTSVSIRRIGDLDIIPNGQGGVFSSKVLYVPDLNYHRLSVKELCLLGLLVKFFEDHVWIRNKVSR